MIHRHKKRHPWALYFAGFFIFTHLIGVFAPIATVYAEDPPVGSVGPAGGVGPAGPIGGYVNDPVTAKAVKWVLARAVAECLNANGVQSKDSPDEITQGDITAGEYVGRLVEGTGSNDAQVDCDPIWQEAHNQLGWNTEDTVCDVLKFTREVGTCKRGDDGYIKPSTSKSKLKDAWNAHFQATYLGGKGISESATDGMRYLIYFGDFKEKCGNDQGASGFKVYEWEEGTDVSGKREYHLPWYQDGKIQDSYVIAESVSSDADVRISGYGLLDNRGDQNDIISCGDLAKNMVQYAPGLQVDLDNDAKTGLTQGSTTGASSSSAGGPAGKDCYNSGGALSWILCPLIDLVDGTLSWLDKQINDLLFVGKEYYSTKTLGPSWSAMRNIAYLILIPMMLFMVIGTAIGVGPFDAYTVKKALPRMVAAVIFISLSLPITQLGVIVSNSVGNGIGNFILSATPGANRVESLSDIFTATSSGGTDTTLGLGVLVGAVAGLAVGLTVLSFAAVAVVGLLIGFVVLVMRQVLIVTMIVIAPLAILVWIFPGNDKLWTIWKTTFIAMLMMYPIISLLIASGKFVAGIIG